MTIDKADILYKNILESMDNGVISLDFEGKIITFNSACSRILGIEIDDAIGKYYSEVFFNLQVNDEFNDVFINVIYSKLTNFYHEVAFNTSKNTSIPIGIKCSLLKDEQGKDYGIIAVISDLSEIKKRRFLEETLTRYLTKQVVHHILKNPDSVTLDGEERESTILFTDIRDFVSLSETMEPKELIDMLRAYFTLMVGAVFQFQGTVDKFIGDSIMCIFGAPAPQANHAEQAVKAALEMLELLESFNNSRKKMGFESIRIGIGICTGKVIVGNIGSHDRFEYTAIGDSVNLAARLEGTTKLYGTKINISDSTHQYTKKLFLGRELDRVRMKGKAEPVKIFEVMGGVKDISRDKKRIHREFAKGLKLFQQRKWDKANQQFQSVLELHPSDGPAKIYIKRTAEYQKNPPPDDWDGVFDMNILKTGFDNMAGKF